MKALTLSRNEALRIALAAQGFGKPRAAGKNGPCDRGHLGRAVKRAGLLQIDSVNVLVRAHYMPLFSRLGPYPQSLLDEAAWGKKRTLFEYWAHEASLLPLDMHPLLRWRMERAARGQGIYGRLARISRERPELVASALAMVRERGPVAASELDSDLQGRRGSGGWWGWSDVKCALEYLFWAGMVTTRTRRGFERLYDLPERALPRAVLNLPTPDEPEAHRRLLELSGRALGIATIADLRDYFRLDANDVKPRIAELVEDGTLLPVDVEGWNQQGYLHRDARRPRRIEAAALLSPFDPVVWERTRTERLFGFRYRLEIYTPAAKRLHGYYVLPFLLGDRLVARVDLKAERATGTLHVLAAHAEPHAPPHTADALLAELRLMSEWLGLERLVIVDRGDLAPALRR
ncbi:winged helix DNA-binding domain-containing protein (plasmid) [Skermanella mucosa]|uniref:winged helix-turn-helix domain-containing protein n=1 Tax=Skermanella mucosa TaxID=1789672 RepID=UPI00192A80B6|nr:crosslink repair DNA glycosylase YcaQ family protein [Skermanella mucosa]UEM25362.1 winged helix DNA-binding domain-containing protein [Skermanella mucosa]